MKVLNWQESIWQRLISDPRWLPHALLLKGRKGIGKLDFARLLAQSLLCESPLSGSACGACQACGWFAQSVHPDFRLIEPESLAETMAETEAESKEREVGKKPKNQIIIDQVRALSDFVNITAHRNGFKVILIHPAEAMNISAANALLKTLEEPPPRTLFILVSHRPRQLLPTIVSRCQIIPMPVPDAAQAERWLAQQGIENPRSCLAHSGYAPLEALELAAVEEYQRQHQAFLREISLPAKLDSISLAYQLAEAIRKSELAKEENARKLDLVRVVEWLQKWCYDLICLNFNARIRYHLELQPRLCELAQAVSRAGLLSYYATLLEARRAARHPLNSRLFLEALLLSYCNLLTRS